MKLNPTLLADFYKLSHIEQYPKGTQIVYSTWTCRGSRIKGIDKTVMFGLQGFIKEYLMDYFRDNFFKADLDDVLRQNKRAIEGGLGIMNPNLDHIIALWNLGYLPLEICALEEGTLVPMRVPSFTMVNTHPDFFWLTNGMETLLSTETWSSITTATIAKEYRKILDSFAIETTGSTDGVDFQAHDFSMRGMSGLSHASKAGCGHLLSFLGTDCIPSMFYLEDYYGGNMDALGVGGSIPATEHSVQCANMPDDQDETSTIKRMITEVYPSGLVAMVLDTMDFWDNVTRVLPSLKPEIMAREGKLVVRPDSGDPVDIICGTLGTIKDYTENCEDMDSLKEWVNEDLLEEFVHNISLEPGECGPDEISTRVKWFGEYYDIALGNIEWNRYDKLYYYHDQYSDYTWDIKKVDVTPEMKGLIEVLFEEFGGYTNHLGYKVLDEHIGAIYGDSITLERAREICTKLKAKGFASTNIVLGVGSYSYQYHTRDTFGQAFKSTYTLIKDENGVIREKLLSKNPKTDDGLKKSAKGMVAVVFNEDTQDLEMVDGLYSFEKTFLKADDLLVPVFRDGHLLVDQTLEEIRERVKRD